MIELLRSYPNTFYTDSFSPKSFVSHNTAVSKEELRKRSICYLKYKTRFSYLLNFRQFLLKEKRELNELLGIITRVLDGHGYESDSGAQGHRGYNEKIMFVWIGAAVEIPHKVHKLLGTLGPKLYFFRQKTSDNSEEYYLAQIHDENNNKGFRYKVEEIKKVLWDYLNWFDICPIAEKDLQDNIKIPWSSGDDSTTNEITIQRSKRD